MATMIAAAVFAYTASAVRAAESDRAAQADALQESFADIGQKISRSDAKEALKIAEEAVSSCKVYDDYERLASELKKASQDQVVKNLDAIYYAMAKARLDQLAVLSQSNDLQAGRLYMSVSDQYYNEAAEYIEKAGAIAGSNDIAIDLDVLRFLIAKEKFQTEKADELLDRIAQDIFSYSDKMSANNEKLSQVADRLSSRGLTEAALKLKTTYASKADEKSAQEILEGIKKSADELFAKGDTRGASRLYEQYIKTSQKFSSKEVTAPKVMEIAEKYFAAGKFKDARAYYELYAQEYSDSKVLDYCAYRIALCYYNEKDMVETVACLEKFLDVYKNSIWFDKAFETLAKLYYVNYSRDDAVTNLRRLIDSYYRKNTGDYARVMIALLYYGDRQFDKALEELKKIDDTSIYSYPASVITEDIASINKGSPPTLTVASKDTYKIWEPHSEVSVMVVPFEGDKKLEYTYVDGVPHLEVAQGVKIKFDVQSLEDLDKFGEYLQDKDDISRLPKLLSENTEKDLMSVEWSSIDGGQFADDKQSKAKVWQSPQSPGSYKVTIRLEDFGLVRSPDKGSRKDPTKEFTIIVDVK